MWQVDDTATIDGTQIKTWISNSSYVTDEDHFLAVRAKSVDSSGNETILGIYFGGSVEDGELGVEIGDNGGYWGAGVPTGNQSLTGHKTWYTSTDGPEVILEDPAVIDALFLLEIGYNSYDGNIGDYVWETLAESLPKETYEALRSQYMYGEGTLGPHKNDIWTPTEFYTHPPVPEPSSFLLSLIGCSFLLLRRKGSHGQI